MRIIKEVHDGSEYYWPVRIICPSCASIFEVDTEDIFETEYNLSYDYFSYRCPVCGTRHVGKRNTKPNIID